MRAYFNNLVKKVAHVVAKKAQMVAYTGEPYKGAAIRDRSVATWNPMLQPHRRAYSPWVRKTATARAKYADNNMPIARAATNKVTNNVVGCGLKLSAKPDYKTIGITEEEANEAAKQIEKYFHLWAKNPKECAIDGVENFFEMQDTVVVNELVLGDLLANTPTEKRDNCYFELKVQLISGERLSNPWGMVNTEYLTDGIGHDEYGFDHTYHVLRAHPQDIHDVVGANMWMELPVYDPETGRMRVSHIFNRRMSDQKRGEPYLLPVLDKLKNIDKLGENEIIAGVIQSFFSAFIYSEHPQEMNLGGMAPPMGAYPVDPGAHTEEELHMAPGAILGLRPGEKVDFANPSRPNQQALEFQQEFAKQVGACLDLPVEVLMQSFNSSYSAARAAIEDAWTFFKKRREHIAQRFCNPVYCLFLDELVARGLVSLKDYADPIKRAAWSNAQWIGPGKTIIDRQKDISSAAQSIAVGLSTIEEEALARGKDPDELLTQIKKEVKQRKEAGINDVRIAPVEVPTGTKPEEPTKSVDEMDSETAGDPS